MILSYVALALLIVMIIVIVYAFIWIHDIPYMLAKKRNHPNLHAIHIACWLSLFTLHAIWPIVFIWAVSKQGPTDDADAVRRPDDPDLSRRLGALEDKFQNLQKQLSASPRKPGKS